MKVSVIVEIESLFIEEYIISSDMDITGVIKVHLYYRDAFRKLIYSYLNWMINNINNKLKLKTLAVHTFNGFKFSMEKYMYIYDEWCHCHYKQNVVLFHVADRRIY